MAVQCVDGRSHPPCAYLTHLSVSVQILLCNMELDCADFSLPREEGPAVVSGFTLNLGDSSSGSI